MNIYIFITAIFTLGAMAKTIHAARRGWETSDTFFSCGLWFVLGLAWSAIPL